MNEQMKEKTENDILFSKAVKAGKRIYYIDVKQDRHSELYLSITESKRVKEGSEDARPVFEKHKIFLYREDIEKFMAAFSAAAQYTQENSGGSARSAASRSEFFSESQIPDYNEEEEETGNNAETETDILHKPASDFRLDIDF